MTGVYRVGQVCVNGHEITDSADAYPQHRQAFCSKCGAPTVMSCTNCNTHIRGDYFIEGVFVRSDWTAPRHCHQCGVPYPWTVAKLQAATHLIDELDELTDDERAKLKASVDELVREAPSSELAAMRVKKAFLKVGKAGSQALRDVLVSVLGEVAKKSVGL